MTGVLTAANLTPVVESPLSLRVWENVKEALCCWPSWKKRINLQFLSCQGSQLWAPANVMLIKTKQWVAGPLRAAFMCLPYSYKLRQRTVIYRAPACISRKRMGIWTVIVVLLRLLHLGYLMTLSMAGPTEVHGIDHKDLVPVQTIRELTHTKCTCSET